MRRRGGSEGFTLLELIVAVGLMVILMSAVAYIFFTSTETVNINEARTRIYVSARTGLDMLEHAWDFGYKNRSNVVDVYVRYLREKVDRPFGVESIETVRGGGYRLRADGGAS